MASESKIINYLTDEQITMIKAPIQKKYIQTAPDGFRYVNVNIVINLLNKIFGYFWSWEIKEQGIEPIHIYKKDREAIGCYAWTRGVLSVPVYDANGNMFMMKKEAFGGKSLVGSGKVQSQTLKIAASDALKKAASMLGIAPNVYISDEIYNNIQEDAIQEDSWTDIKVEKYKTQIDKMLEYKKNLGDSTLEDYKKAFCDEIGFYTIYGEITPSNIDSFLEYMSAIPVAPKQSKVLINDNPFL